MVHPASPKGLASTSPASRRFKSGDGLQRRSGSIVAIGPSPAGAVMSGREASLFRPRFDEVGVSPVRLGPRVRPDRERPDRRSIPTVSRRQRMALSGAETRSVGPVRAAVCFLSFGRSTRNSSRSQKMRSSMFTAWRPFGSMAMPGTVGSCLSLAPLLAHLPHSDLAAGAGGRVDDVGRGRRAHNSTASVYTRTFGIRRPAEAASSPSSPVFRSRLRAKLVVPDTPIRRFVPSRMESPEDRVCGWRLPGRVTSRSALGRPKSSVAVLIFLDVFKLER